MELPWNNYCEKHNKNSFALRPKRVVWGFVILDKKMAYMEEKITNTVTEKVTETVKDLLTQFLQQQQPKQEINNKGDIENKHDGKDM